jgi:hypothetical protein
MLGRKPKKSTLVTCLRKEKTMPWDLNGNPDGDIGANSFLGTRANDPLRIRTNSNVNNANAMTITPAPNATTTGNVGIGTGTAAIQRTLHVRGSEIHSEGSAAGFSFGNRQTADPFAPGAAPGERWVWYASGGTARLWSLGDKLFVTPEGNVGIGTGTAAIQRTLHVRGSEIHSEGNVAGFSFGNRQTADPFAPGAAPGERWVWYASGGVARLWTLGDRLFVTPAGNVTIAGTLSQGSDARMKANIAKLTDVLSKLEAINGVSFERIGSHTLTVRSAQQRDIGVIAQEVEAAFPELVSTHGHENHKAVNYSGLTGVLIEASKELKAQNDELRSRIEALERA